MVTINTQIDPQYQAWIDSPRLTAIIQNTLHSCHVDNAELTLVVTSDVILRQLNHDYRGIDEITDVLSFESKSTDDMFVNPLESIPYLGDVIISAPTATKQASIAGHAPFEEVIFLAVHGTLHLLGFEHDTSSEKEVMWQKQNQILCKNQLEHLSTTPRAVQCYFLTR